MSWVTSVPLPVLSVRSNLDKATEGLRWLKYGAPLASVSGTILAIVRPLSVTRICPCREAWRTNSPVFAWSCRIVTVFMCHTVTQSVSDVNRLRFTMRSAGCEAIKSERNELIACENKPKRWDSNSLNYNDLHRGYLEVLD